MTIEQMLQWKEPRITLNESHPFWLMENPIMTLKGKFVEDCLWTPNMYYISADKISFHNPTPTQAVGSPVSYHLNYTRSITSWFHISKLTLSCGMDFSWYPFDLQVSDKNVALTFLNLMVVRYYVNGIIDSTFVKNSSDSLKSNSKYPYIVGLSRN